jgi:hypothetical protein
MSQMQEDSFFDNLMENVCIQKGKIELIIDFNY